MPGSGLAFQSITIAGRTYTLKPDGLYEYFADMWGVDFSTLGEQLAPDKKTGRFVLFVKLFAALTAHNFLKIYQPARTPEEWAALIPKEQIKEMVDAVVAAAWPKKIQPEQVSQPTPAPDQSAAQPN